MRKASLVVILALAGVACSGQREDAAIDPDERVAGLAEPADAQRPEDPWTGLEDSVRRLCHEMSELAHEAYGGRPHFVRERSRLQSSDAGRVFAACSVTVEVDHFAETGGSAVDILERVRRAGWSHRDGGDKLPGGEVAFALEREVDLCFVRWLGESHPAWRADAAAVRFICAVTDWDNVRARDPG